MCFGPRPLVDRIARTTRNHLSVESSMISAVIPVFNEVDSLVQLHSELSQVAEQNNYDIEIIFVDDGSSDGSWGVISQLAEKDSRVSGICFRRNFGKAAALNAGFASAKGDIIFTLDADLQDDPAEMPRFLEKMKEGCDVVSGWKQVRHDPWHKVGPSRIFNAMVGYLSGVHLHDHNCGYKCYKAEIFQEVSLYGEMHRFVPVLASARGWSVGEIIVNHRAREHGVSKYGVSRIVKGFLDLLTVTFLTGYGQRPQHMLGAIGLGSFGIGAIFSIILAALWVFSRLPLGLMDPVNLHQRAIFYYAIVAVIVGVQCMTAGLVAELMTEHQSREVDAFAIAHRVGGDPTETAEPTHKELAQQQPANTPPSAEQQIDPPPPPRWS